MRAIIITGGDAGYFTLMSECLMSLAPFCAANGVARGALDFGLVADQRQELARAGIAVVSPGWDYPLATFDTPPPDYFRAMTARPHLPAHFPGYDLYMWLDADCWVQDEAAVRLYLDAAAELGFAVTPETDRSYGPFFQNLSLIDLLHRCYTTCYDDKAALALTHYPVINCGAFAALGDAPHWAAWSAELGEVLARIRQPFFFAEQTALNKMLRENRLPVGYLPSRCNWMCHRAFPRLAADGITFCEPHPPYQPLGILHLVANTKAEEWIVFDVFGNEYRRSLRYSARPSPAGVARG